MDAKRRLHEHHAMQRDLGVPDDHVIIDRDVFAELIKERMPGGEWVDKEKEWTDRAFEVAVKAAVNEWLEGRPNQIADLYFQAVKEAASDWMHDHPATISRAISEGGK